MTRSLLLDTCAILWLASDPDRISPEVRSAIADAPLVYYSPISAWEIALKAALGRIALPLPPREWFSRAVRHHGLEPIPLREEILFRATELPWHHKDPADRFIIATALVDRHPVVTGDDRFAAYGVETLI